MFTFTERDGQVEACENCISLSGTLLCNHGFVLYHLSKYGCDSALSANVICMDIEGLCEYTPVCYHDVEMMYIKHMQIIRGYIFFFFFNELNQ